MNTKKVATNIPEKLLSEAVRLTGLNQTQAIVAGLEELIAREKRIQLLGMKGKLQVSVDLASTRKRKRLK